MDTSETYIEMCDCPEIQPKREGTIGNIYYDKVDKSVYTLGCTRNDGVNPFVPLQVRLEDEGRYIWLPRQDQLQKMVTRDGNLPVWKVEEWFHNWIPLGACPDSFEQLWLAFVMKEKHNKIWDGKWVDRV